MINRGWAALVLVSSVVVACDGDSTGPESATGVVAHVELNGSRPELYIQNVAGTERPTNRVQKVTTGAGLGVVVDLATQNNSLARAGLIGDIQAIARDGSWVLLLRNTAAQGNGDLIRALVKVDLQTGVETTVADRSRIQYAELLPGDNQVLYVTDVSNNAGSSDYQYLTVGLNGGETRVVRGTSPFTLNLALHPTVKR